jgi:hypothetical protein
MVTNRAFCSIHSWSGCGVIPARHTLRLLQLDEKQYIICNQPSEGQNLHGEEIRPHKNIHVCANEVSPTDRVLALGCRRDSVATQDISDRLVGQPMAKIRQRTHNAIITPGGILLRHLHHQGFCHFVHGRPPQRTTVP